jgi:glutathione synthase/RimK-type ligase-like ATP-grasp enzyme
MRTIVLATCARWPHLNPSDACLATALRTRGWETRTAAWNRDFAPFAGAAAVVVRATWDYHEAPDAYLAWLDRLDPRRTFNAPELIRWNLTKTHVLDLGRRGARIPRSIDTDAEPAAIAEALDRLGLRDAVIKPLIGASGFGVERVRRGEEAAALARARALKPTDRVLVQEFLPAIAAGELAGVFFDGVFSHGLRRLPAPGEFRINWQYGGRMEAAELDPGIVAQMRDVLALLPERPLYARIDGVADGHRLVVMEVEVNEPGLGMELVPGSGERFAEALLARLPA